MRDEEWSSSREARSYSRVVKKASLLQRSNLVKVEVHMNSGSPVYSEGGDGALYQLQQLGGARGRGPRVPW